jgi:hypothetical protein
MKNEKSLTLQDRRWKRQKYPAIPLPAAEG